MMQIRCQWQWGDIHLLLLLIRSYAKDETRWQQRQSKELLVKKMQIKSAWRPHQLPKKTALGEMQARTALFNRRARQGDVMHDACQSNSTSAQAAHSTAASSS
jgi:hypothetical protein